MAKSKSLVIVVILIVAAGIAGSFLTQAEGQIVKVGGTAITETDVTQRIASFPAQLQSAFNQPEAREQLIVQLIDEAVLLEAAKKSGIQKSDAYKAQMEFAEKQLLLSLLIQENIDSQVNITEKDVEAYYTQNKAQFSASQQRRASHILVKTKAQADKVRRQAVNGADFAKLAAKNSEDPGSKNRGGDLGWFNKGQLVPEFEKAVYGLKSKGSISAVVKTQFGFHVIRLDGIQNKPAVSLEDAKQQIVQLLVNNQKQLLTQEFLENAKKSIKIKRAKSTQDAEAPAAADASQPDNKQS